MLTLNMTMTSLLFTLHLASTLFITGVIWFVQIVHYPLFIAVGAETFDVYERKHQVYTSFVVVPAMLLELGTALILFINNDPNGSLLFELSLIFLAIIWLSTFLIQVPLHSKLESGYDAKTIQKLVLTNWLRTVAWSLRSGVLLILCHLSQLPDSSSLLPDLPNL